ncbi:MAG: hypothetical protein LLF82_000312 [Dehalococcoides mccartyi]|nr:hypothetical protein [Dehalococcoides mccartyi]
MLGLDLNLNGVSTGHWCNLAIKMGLILTTRPPLSEVGVERVGL